MPMDIVEDGDCIMCSPVDSDIQIDSFQYHPPSNKRILNFALVFGSLALVTIIVAAAVAIFFVCYLRRRRLRRARSERHMLRFHGGRMVLKMLSLNEIRTATNGFNRDKIIGEGASVVFSGVPSLKTDVYSFGVVVLEVATGRRPVDEERLAVTDFVWDLWGKGMLCKAADPKLMNRFSKLEMERTLVVGLVCANPNCDRRPTMREAARMLRGETALPVLPSRKPTVRIQSVLPEGCEEIMNCDHIMMCGRYVEL